MTNKPARILVQPISQRHRTEHFLRQGDCRASRRGGPCAPRSHGIRRSKRRYRDSGRGRAHSRGLRVWAKQALKQAGANGSARTHTHIKRGISPAEVIIDAVGEYACDLVIMGTHGRRGFKRLLAGSVAREVVHLSPVPVLTTRGKSDGRFPPLQILVPVDFSESCFKAIRWVGAVATVLGAEITHCTRSSRWSTHNVTLSTRRRTSTRSSLSCGARRPSNRWPVKI